MAGRSVTTNGSPCCSPASAADDGPDSQARSCGGLTDAGACVPVLPASTRGHEALPRELATPDHPMTAAGAAAGAGSAGRTPAIIMPISSRLADRGSAEPMILPSYL